jgi:hypothetical protein
MAEEIIHTEGQFRFINRTRYESEDIKAILRLYSEVAQQHGAPSDKPVRPDRYRDEDSLVYDIADYNPSVVWEDKSVWESNGNRPVTKRVGNFVRMPGWSLSTRWKIGFISPEKIHSSPLEALSSDTTKSTPEFVTAVAEMILYMFAPNVSGWESLSAVKASALALVKSRGLEIRVNAKRENPVKSNTRVRRHTQAVVITDISRIKETLSAATGMLGSALGNFKSVEGGCESLSVDLGMNEEPLQEALRLSLAVLTHMDITLARIREA